MKVITFGEIMLRLTPQNHNRIGRTPVYEATYGGAESNVACSLAQLGIETEFVTKLPENAVAEGAIATLKSFGVGTDFIARGGNRMGVYYLERGSSVRASKVVYDRADSAMAQAQTADFDWDEIFRGAAWFHFTGITAGISKNALALCKIAAKKAKEKGLTVSFDPNYRAKLWTKEEARAAMKELTPYVDVLISNAPQTLDVYELDFGSEEKTMRALAEKFDLQSVVFTDRISRSADDNGYSASCFAGCKGGKGGKYYVSKRYELHPIVDRVGGGDAFAAGYIFAANKYENEQQRLDFAVAAAAFKHTIDGDINLAGESEIAALAGGDGSGRVQR